jgi:hypothetical protein
VNSHRQDVPLNIEFPGFAFTAADGGWSRFQESASADPADRASLGDEGPIIKGTADIRDFVGREIEFTGSGRKNQVTGMG